MRLQDPPITEQACAEAEDLEMVRRATRFGIVSELLRQVEAIAVRGEYRTRGTDPSFGSDGALW